MTHLSKRNITLTKNEIQKCISFAEEFASNKAEKSSNDFGSTNIRTRDLTDKTADTITGKLAEFAFMKFCQINDIKIEIDFDISDGRLNIDNGQDIVSFQGKENNIKCDIKGAKHFAQWLMVESHKLDEDLIIADIYIFVKLNLPKGVEQDLELFNESQIDAEIVGYAFKEDFFDSEGNPWFHYKAGNSPLRMKYVKKIVNESKNNLDNSDELKKSDLVENYRRLIKNNKDNDIFLKMTQKAAHNFGLPVDYLRSSDIQLKKLFTLLSDQKLPKKIETIFNNV